MTSAVNFVFVLFGAVILYMVFRWVRWLLSVAPMGKSRRARINRIRPLLEAVVFLGFLALSVPIVLGGQTLATAIVLGLMLLAFVLLCWFAFRDAVAGMFLKASEFCRPGDLVEVDGAQGTVRGLGYRMLAIETDQGERVFVPYSRVTRQSLRCTPAEEGAFRHRFELTIPSSKSPIRDMEAIRRAALNCHFSSVVKEPQIEDLGHGSYDVTVFVFDPKRCQDVENQVKKLVDAKKESSVIDS